MKKYWEIYGTANLLQEIQDNEDYNSSEPGNRVGYALLGLDSETNVVINWAGLIQLAWTIASNAKDLPLLTLWSYILYGREVGVETSDSRARINTKQAKAQEWIWPNLKNLEKS